MPVWNIENAGHLLRRAAFGGSPEDVQEIFERHASVESAVDELLSFKPSRRKPPQRKDTDGDSKRKMQRWWLKQMIKARHPRDAAREKLVLFLHNFLVSGTDKQPELRTLSWQNGMFRELGKGDFKALIREFNRDPANLFYLDGILNDARNAAGVVVANENWGREFLELFTLGPFQIADDGLDDPAKPNYTEDDVHNVSRASTGWIEIDEKEKKGVFVIQAWDGGQYDDDGDGLPDPMVIFGQASNNFRFDDAVAGTSDDVIELVFSRTDDDGNNQVGMFVARKVWEWYAYPPPAAGLKSVLAGLASAFAGSGFLMEALLRAAWTHDEFYSTAAKTRTVKSPVDYVVQAMKALHVRGNARFVGDANEELSDQVAGMGMDLFNPPNVAGWPGGLAWITSGTLIERLRFARDLAAADFGPHKVKFRKLERIPLGTAAADPADVVDAVIAQFGLDQGPLALTSGQRDALIAYASDDGTRVSLDLSHEFTDDVQTKVRGLLALVMQAAEAHVF